jgi:hypothetical protein
MARAAIAAGADGLMIEVHHDPEHALGDGAQSLCEQFRELVSRSAPLPACWAGGWRSHGERRAPGPEVPRRSHWWERSQSGS